MRKAILMAAGRGTRISRNIEDNCKCTLDIGGTSLIRHTVEMLLERGIETHIVVGFQKNKIYKALEGLPVTFHENYFFSITNSLASLWWAREELCGDTVILGNADVYWETNLLDTLLKETRDCAMLCDSSRVEQGDYLFNVKNGVIVDYGKGMDCKKANCEYVGIAVIKAGLIEECRHRLERMIENQRHGLWWEDVLYGMTSQRDIYTIDIAGNFWAEIDYIEDYNRILEYRKAQGKI